MIHNISSEGIRLMKEYAAEFYGVTPTQIVVRHGNVILNAASSDGMLNWRKDNLYYLLGAQFSHFSPDPFDITFRVTEKYMSNKVYTLGFFNSEDYDADKLSDFKEKFFYFNQVELVDSFGAIDLHLSVLRFNII